MVLFIDQDMYCNGDHQNKKNWRKNQNDQKLIIYINL